MCLLNISFNGGSGVKAMDAFDKSLPSILVDVASSYDRLCQVIFLDPWSWLLFYVFKQMLLTRNYPMLYSCRLLPYVCS